MLSTWTPSAPAFKWQEELKNKQASGRSSRAATEPQDASDVRTLVIGRGRGVSGAKQIEGVRGRAAKVLHGSGSGTAFDVDLYVAELASRGYQLHQSLHVGVSSQIYRAFRTQQQQTLDVTSSSQLMTEDEVRNMPVTCALDQSFTQTVKGRLRYSDLQIKCIRFILLLFPIYAWSNM